MTDINDLNRRIATVLGATFALYDYARDLNHMWQLEEELSGSEWVEYSEHLIAVLNGKPGGGILTQYIIHATAQQRAEAWLAVKEGKP